jgi:hypothetical protein
VQNAVRRWNNGSIVLKKVLGETSMGALYYILWLGGIFVVAIGLFYGLRAAKII